MRFHCTNKLLNLLKRSSEMADNQSFSLDVIESNIEQDELYDWHASVVELGEQYIVTFTNDLTQLPVVVGLLKLEALSDIVEHFKKTLAQLMDELLFEESVIFDYLKAIHPSSITKSISRTKLGPLNAVTSSLSDLTEEMDPENFDSIEMTKQLFEVPRTKAGKSFMPIDKWLTVWEERMDKQIPNLSEEVFDTIKDSSLSYDSVTEEWEKLYSFIDQIKLIQPWRNLSDLEWIVVQNPDTEEWTYCTIMGNHGTFYGIGLFTGNEGLKSLYNVYAQNHVVQDYQLKAVQNSIVISFIDIGIEEIETDNLQRLAKLNRLKTDDRLTPEIMKHTPGFVPWSILTDQEVEWTTVVLEQIVEVISEFGNTELPSANDGQAAGRFLRKNEWKTEIVSLPEQETLSASKERVIYRNELALYQIKNAPKSKQVIQLDAAYAPAIIQEHPQERPFYPMLALCVEKGSGMVLNVKTFPEMSQAPKQILDCLAEVCIKERPKEIITRKDSIEWVIEDFCKKAKIQLTVAEELPELDDVMRSMEEDME